MQHVNAPQYKRTKRPPCQCSRLPFPHRKTTACEQEPADGTDYALEERRERAYMDRDAARACNEIRNRG